MNRLSCDGANNAAIALMIGACVGILFRLITTSNTYDEDEDDPYLEAVKNHAKKVLYPDKPNR